MFGQKEDSRRRADDTPHSKAGIPKLPTPDKKTPSAEPRPRAFSFLVERRNSLMKTSGLSYFLSVFGRVFFFFCLPVDNSDDKDGFLEQVFVLFVTMSAQQEAGSWIMGPLWERG